MGNEWIDTTLGSVLTLQRGFDLSAEKRESGVIPVIASTGIVGFHNEVKVKAPGVVIGRSGSIGGGQYIEMDYWPLNTTLWVKDFKGNDPRYCYYLLRSLDFTVFNAGSGVPTLNRNHIHPLPVRKAPRAHQKAIASILGSLDDKIELNRKINETLEAMARAIFKSWFVDFEPIPGIGPHKKWQDSPLGKIPKGWKVMTVPEAFEINPTRQLSKGMVAPYLDMGNMPTLFARATEWASREFTSGMKFINGDVLLARITPCLENGKTAYVDFLKDDTVGWGSTEYIVFRSKPPLPSEYMYFLARVEDFRLHAIQNMTGSSGRQRVPVSCFDTYRVIVPSDDAAKRFGVFAKEVFAKMKRNDEQSRTLAAIRDALLPKLLSGEIQVKGVKKFVATTDVAQSKASAPTKQKKASDEFREAVLIASLTRALANDGYTLGRFRCTKVSYLVHRKVAHDVQRKYFKKAAGPYNPSIKYKGPENIALKNGYIQAGKPSGFVAGPKIADIDKYLDNYGFKPAIEWAVQTFRYKKNDALELLTTVDFAVLDLQGKGQPVTVKSICALIESEPEWAPKLNRAIFSELNIGRALKELNGYFPETYIGGV